VPFSLSPDHSISVKDSFAAAAKHIMRESRELRVLWSVESPEHLEGEAFSSWVPDWRAFSESYLNVLHDRNPDPGIRQQEGQSIVTIFLQM
jgi:hypothetical protein